VGSFKLPLKAYPVLKTKAHVKTGTITKGLFLLSTAYQLHVINESKGTGKIGPSFQSWAFLWHTIFISIYTY
jgi:hypothetical protein